MAARATGMRSAGVARSSDRRRASYASRQRALSAARSRSPPGQPSDARGAAAPTRSSSERPPKLPASVAPVMRFRVPESTEWRGRLDRRLRETATRRLTPDQRRKGRQLEAALRAARPGDLDALAGYYGTD